MSMEAEASNQVLSMTLEGVKITAELTGKASKEITIALFAAIRSIVQKYNAKKQLTPGQQKLINMLQSGKPLNQFVISNEHLDSVRSEAVKRGITYSAVKNRKGGISYITVYQQDAARVNRLLEDLGVGDVDYINMKAEPDTSPVIQPEEINTDSAASNSEKGVSSSEIMNSNESTGEAAEMSEEDIDDIFEALEPIESDGGNPLDQATKDDEAQLGSSSSLTQKEAGTDLELSDINKESNFGLEKREPADKTFKDNLVDLDPSKRPSVRKHVSEILDSQLADKASKAEQVIEKAAETAKEAVRK